MKRRTPIASPTGMPDVLGGDARPLCQQGRGGSRRRTLGRRHHSRPRTPEASTEPETRIVWLLRGDKPEKSFGGGANDKLAARGELGKVFADLVQGGSVARRRSDFRLTHIRQRDGRKLRLGAGSACCGRHI